MGHRRLVVIEVNEVPRRVLVDVAAEGRAPFLAGLLADDQVVETVVAESLPREMYPSQTWASLNTGVPWCDHRVWWYGDPKPAEYPLYWQVAASSNRSVGLVNTLHSSPLSVQCASGDYRFVLPDCFATDSETLPERYQDFQELNLRLTRANSRQSNIGSASKEAGLAVKALARLGLTAPALGRISRLTTDVFLGRVPRERLRSGQFLVLADLFERLLAAEAPDLAVMFTNHVAAVMHRYWYAMYPDDFDVDHYPPAWVDQHREEIPAAVEMLDRFLSRLDVWCRRNERTLIVVSSMGQGPSRRLDSERTHEAIVVSPETFLAAVGIGRSTNESAAAWSGDRLLTDVDMPSIRGSMAPNLTLDCQSEVDAERIGRHLSSLGAGRAGWIVDRVDEVVTLTYDIEVADPATVVIAEQEVSAASVGVDVYEVDDHSSGRHVPEGIVAVSNSPSFKQPADRRVDYLDFAPAVLDLLAVDRLDHHRSPLLQL